MSGPQGHSEAISQNTLEGNGLNPPPIGPLEILAADLTYFMLFETSSGNCFDRNKPEGEVTFVSTEPDGLLPTDGC